MIIFMNHVLVAEHSLKAGILYTTVKVCSKQGSLRHQGLDCQIIRIHCCDRNSFSRICYNQLIRNHSRRYWALIWIIISILFGLSFVGQTIKLRFKFLQAHSIWTTNCDPQFNRNISVNPFEERFDALSPIQRVIYIQRKMWIHFTTYTIRWVV